MADLVVKSKVKELIGKEGMMTASDSLDALDREVEEIVKKACKRCKERGAKTVKPFDF